MLSPADFNNAVPQFTNGTYASNPINPQYVNEPTSTEYNQGVEPLQTLPAQWWNWFINKFTGRFNKINTYVKNIFNELTELLSLGNITPDGTEATPTTCQLKDMFASCYPDYVKCCTTGTACGCIPVIGADLGNTNNNILVTDASGHLKPSGITVGTAAGCDASCFLPAGSAVCRATLLTSDIIDPQTGLVCGYHSVSLCVDPSSDYPGMCELYLYGTCHTCSCPEGLQEEVLADNALSSCISCCANVSWALQEHINYGVFVGACGDYSNYIVKLYGCRPNTPQIRWEVCTHIAGGLTLVPDAICFYKTGCGSCCCPVCACNLCQFPVIALGDKGIQTCRAGDVVNIIGRCFSCCQKVSLGCLCSSCGWNVKVPGIRIY